MLLAIDVGNTNIHFGLWDGERWRLTWRARTIADKMPDEYATLLSSFLRDSNLSYASINDVVIASVVPPLTASFVEMTQHYIEVEPLVISARVKTGIRIDV